MSSLILSLVVAAILGLLAARRFASSPRPNMPYLKLEGDQSRTRYAAESVNLMSKGFTRYIKNGKPFMMRNMVDDQNPLIILPLKYLEEVKNAPQNKLSFALYVEKNSILGDIGGPRMNDETSHAARIDLNRALANLIEPMRQECLAVFEKAMPPCPDWTPVYPYPFLLQLFTRTSARVLVGPELCRNDEWTEVTHQYIGSFLKAVSSVRARYHPLLRWTAKYLDADAKEVYKHHYRAADIIRPVLRARMDAEEKGIGEQHEDGIQWLMNAYKANGKKPTAEQLALDEMGLSVASIHSSSATLLSTPYDLIDHPDALEGIRAEIMIVSQGRSAWDRPALASLKLLDSFMKESQRVHSVPEATIQRMASVPWTFSDGLSIPAGTQISFPNRQLNLDSDVHPDATTFDAKRFSREREGADENKFHFASISEDSLNFGAGFHACPGSFLAQEAIKLIFVHMLTHCDFKWAEGNESRPADKPDNLLMLPNFATLIMFKSRPEM